MVKRVKISAMDAQSKAHAAIIQAVLVSNGYAALAAALNEHDPKARISNQRVFNWANRDLKAPAELVLSIEAVTGVGRSDLRPDIYPPRMIGVRG